MFDNFKINITGLKVPTFETFIDKVDTAAGTDCDVCLCVECDEDTSDDCDVFLCEHVHIESDEDTSDASLNEEIQKMTKAEMTDLQFKIEVKEVPFNARTIYFAICLVCVLMLSKETKIKHKALPLAGV